MNLDRHIEKLLRCLSERDLKAVSDRAKEIFLEESNV